MLRGPGSCRRSVHRDWFRTRWIPSRVVRTRPEAFKPPERLPEGLPPFPSDQLPQLFDLELWGLAVVQATAAGFHLDERK